MTISSKSHSTLSGTDIHVPYFAKYATKTDMLTATVSDDDVGKIALCNADKTIWILTNATPTWVKINDIQSEGITTSLIADDAITTDKIVDTAVTKAKFNSDTVFTVPTASTAGSIGTVPAPTYANIDKYLQANGSWTTPYTSLNNKQVFTESGSFTAPRSGIYVVTLVGGGQSGGKRIHGDEIAEGGACGHFLHTSFELTKDDVITITIGAGGAVPETADINYYKANTGIGGDTSISLNNTTICMAAGGKTIPGYIHIEDDYNESEDDILLSSSEVIGYITQQGLNYNHARGYRAIDNPYGGTCTVSSSTITTMRPEAGYIIPNTTTPSVERNGCTVTGWGMGGIGQVNNNAATNGYQGIAVIYW